MEEWLVVHGGKLVEQTLIYAYQLQAQGLLQHFFFVFCPKQYKHSTRSIFPNGSEQRTVLIHMDGLEVLLHNNHGLLWGLVVTA